MNLPTLDRPIIILAEDEEAPDTTYKSRLLRLKSMTQEYDAKIDDDEHEPTAEDYNLLWSLIMMA